MGGLAIYTNRLCVLQKHGNIGTRIKAGDGSKRVLSYISTLQSFAPPVYTTVSSRALTVALSFLGDIQLERCVKDANQTDGDPRHVRASPPPTISCMFDVRSPLVARRDSQTTTTQLQVRTTPAHRQLLCCRPVMRDHSSLPDAPMSACAVD